MKKTTIVWLLPALLLLSCKGQERFTTNTEAYSLWQAQSYNKDSVGFYKGQSVTEEAIETGLIDIQVMPMANGPNPTDSATRVAGSSLHIRHRYRKSVLRKDSAAIHLAQTESTSNQLAQNTFSQSGQRVVKAKPKFPLLLLSMGIIVILLFVWWRRKFKF